MIEIKYKNYDELTLEKYLKMKDIIVSNDNDIDKEFNLIALLADISLDEVMECNLGDIQGISNKCNWLATEHINIKGDIHEITINGVDYEVVSDLQNFSVAQYVDFQNYPKDEHHLAENLSTFVIPKGKKYGEGYDVEETISDFNKYMDISTAITLQNFFMRKLLTYIKDILHSLVQLMKMEMKKKKTKKNQEIINQIKEIQEKFGYLL